jgi:cation diffusion facilitator CzcD-associated flavoprotein CzcO
MNKKKVCIVGAGVSGLATAKVFRSQGHDVSVFEKADALGGVWAPSRRHPGLRLQTVRDCYAFSDFPMPSSYPEFPSGRQVHDYLTAYATHFAIIETIKLGAEVTRIAARSDGASGWRVHVRDAKGDETADDFDFVVVCNGIFSEPKIPQIPGRDTFEANGGVVLHSSQIPDDGQLEARAVVVVGFGKSALDIAEASLAKARSTAIVARRIPWKVPHRIWGRAHIKYFVLSRFTELWYPRDETTWLRRLLVTPLVNAYWHVVERVIARQLGLDAPALRPDAPLRKAGACLTLTLDDLKAVRDGRIALHRGGLARFTPSGLALDNGQNIDAQTVILATGYRQRCPFLGEREKAALSGADGAMLLYRFLINPDIPAMGFNGYNGVGSCQLVAEVGACWLAQFMDGRIALPDRAAMFQQIRDETDLRRRLLAAPHGVGFYVTPLTMDYLDRLLADLGLPPADQHRRFFDWLFTPLDPRDYRDLLARPKT